MGHACDLPFPPNEHPDPEGASFMTDIVQPSSVTGLVDQTLSLADGQVSIDDPNTVAAATYTVTLTDRAALPAP
jgi:hypothetical protein